MTIKHTLWLVEDSDDDYYAFKRACRGYENLIDLVRFSSGSDARARFDEVAAGKVDAPHLVILDLNMPGIDGRELLRYIKGTPVLESLPVIIYTTSDAPEDLSQAYEHHANAFHVKPLNYSELENEVHSLLTYWTQCVTLPTAS